MTSRTGRLRTTDDADALRRSIRTTALIILCASAAWAAWIAAFGGFDTTLAGLRIRSNNPQRVMILAAAALLVYFGAGGRIPLALAVVRVRAVAAAAGRRPGWIAAAIALTATVVAAVNSTRIAGGADAYGYVSQAELWLERDLTIEQPWVRGMPFPNVEWIFAPLGYRPGADEWTIVPTYSPGLPMLMAAVKAVGGQCAMFLVVPFTFGAAALATYGIGVRLGGAAAGAIAAWFVATSPAALEVAVESLSDVPAMAAWSLAVYWALGAGARTAAAAGLCAAFGILIRPNLVPLALPIGLWVCARSRTSGARAMAVDAAAFGAGVLPGIAAVALINAHLYGSAGSSGYGDLAAGFAWRHVLPNLARYARWIAETQTPLALIGLAALLVPLHRLWPGVRDRRVFLAVGLFLLLLWAQYAAYLEFDSAGYLRFLLPAWPLMMLGLASALLALARASGPLGRTLVAAAIVALGVWTTAVAVGRGVFEQEQAARHDAPLGAIVREQTPANSVILALHRSGSLRYYAGRITARYDMLDPAWLDRFVEWLTARGVHVYAVVDAREAAEAQARFALQRRATAFERPVLIYEPAATALFDLSNPPEAPAAPPRRSESPVDATDCHPPARRPRLRLAEGDPRTISSRSPTDLPTPSYAGPARRPGPGAGRFRMPLLFGSGT